jgi:hypothetical protein
MKKFTRKQIELVAESILNATMDRIDNVLPPEITIPEYNKNKKHIDILIHHTMDTAAMSLSILFYNITGTGIGAYDWNGSQEFRDYVEKSVKGKRPALNISAIAKLYAKDIK